MSEQKELSGILGEFEQQAVDLRDAIVVAHNSKLLVKALRRAMERSVALESAALAARDFMDYLRTNTGFTDEWPIELKVAPDIVEKVQRLLNEFEATVYAVAPSVVKGAKSATASFIPMSEEILSILNQGRKNEKELGETGGKS